MTHFGTNLEQCDVIDINVQKYTHSMRGGIGGGGRRRRPTV